MNSRKFNIGAAMLISFALLLAAGIGSVYAYLSATADGPTDSFQIANTQNPQVSVAVTQEQSIATASVHVPLAEYKVYVRAIVVVNWIKDGAICATPDGASYVVTANGWTQHSDGFYYYNQAVDSLSDSFEVTYDKKPGYDVQVQVVCQTVQAVGTADEGTDSAVFNAWGVNIG